MSDRKNEKIDLTTAAFVPCSMAVDAGSALVACGCTPTELQALRGNGAVYCEQRGQNAAVYKLRFRSAGKLQVRYLGTSRALVERVECELARLQSARRRRRELQRNTVAVRKALRDWRRQVAPLVEAAGGKLHGFTIRRPRARKPSS